MANHDYVIANQTPNLELILIMLFWLPHKFEVQHQATHLRICFGMIPNNKLMMRNEANSAWITVFESDQSNNRINIITDDIQ